MRGSRRTAAILLAIGLIAPSAAGAANGDQLRQIEAGGGTCGINVGLAFDGTNLYVSCYDDNRIDVVSPADGTLVRTFSVSGVSSLGALAYDGGRKVLWGCSASSQVVQIDPQTGASTPQFSSGGCFDGLAYDGSDDTIWSSADASSPVHHYQVDGTLIQDFPVSLGGYGNSGIAVGGDTLYLANNGGSQIYTTDKTVSAPALFATFPRRLEDMECDERTFSPKAAIWSQDAYDRTLNAYEIPPGSCGVGGAPADTQGPDVTIAADPAPNANGWNRGTVKVTLTASDPEIVGQAPSPAPSVKAASAGKDAAAAPTFPGSGVKSITYELSGATTGTHEVAGDTATFDVPAEGVTTIKAHATDNVGNTSSEKEHVLRIDTHGPAITITKPASDGASFGSGDKIDALFTCADDLSGVAACGPAGSSGSTPLDTGSTGSKTLKIDATDKADNPSSASRGYTVAPAIVAQGPRTCASRRRFKVHMRKIRGVRFVHVKVVLNGKKRNFGVRRDNKGIYVDLRGLPKGRFTITITGRDQNGRLYKNIRHYRTCTPKPARYR